MDHSYNNNCSFIDLGNLGKSALEDYWKDFSNHYYYYYFYHYNYRYI